MKFLIATLLALIGTTAHAASYDCTGCFDPIVVNPHVIDTGDQAKTYLFTEDPDFAVIGGADQARKDLSEIARMGGIKQRIDTPEELAELLSQAAQGTGRFILGSSPTVVLVEGKWSTDRLDFTPALAPVPLPASVLLLAAALVLLRTTGAAKTARQQD